MKKANKPRFPLILRLFLIFFKIGAFTFGGGYTMISLIQREVSEKRPWIADSDILEIVAISESTPGPIAINAATFVGYRLCGFAGAFAATLGVVLPSFILIVLLSFVIEAVQTIKAVKYAFFGIRIGILALILKAVWSMYKQSPKGVIPYILMALAFLAVAVFGLNVLIVIIAAALIGLSASLIAGRMKS